MENIPRTQSCFRMDGIFSSHSGHHIVEKLGQLAHSNRDTFQKSCKIKSLRKTGTKNERVFQLIVYKWQTLHLIISMKGLWNCMTITQTSATKRKYNFMCLSNRFRSFLKKISRVVSKPLLTSMCHLQCGKSNSIVEKKVDTKQKKFGTRRVEKQLTEMFCYVLDLCYKWHLKRSCCDGIRLCMSLELGR